MVKWLRRHWPALFLLAAALITLYMDEYVAQHFLDGDTSDYLHNAWVMAQEKTPFPRDYYGSTEPRLLDVAFVFSLFMPFVSDWTLVRVLGTALMQALYVCSFLFMTRRAGVGKHARLTAAALLLLPFSTSYARLVLYHLHYLLYLTNAFWLTGLMLWTLNALETSPRKALLPGCLTALMWLFVGLNGIRHMLILGAPMLLFLLVRLYQGLNVRKVRRWTELRRELTQGGESVFRLTGLWFWGCAFFLVGFILCQAVVLPYFHIMDSSTLRFRPNADPSRYTGIFNGLLSAIGVRDSSLPLISVRGLSLLAALFAFGWLMFLSIREGLTCRDSALGKQLLLSLLGASFVTTTLVFIFGSDDLHYDYYYVPVTAMLFPALAVELDRAREKDALLTRRVLAAITCLCLLFQSGYTMWYLRVEKDDMDTFSGLAFPTLDAADEVRDCVDFMQREGYSYAIINYWYANVMMELSDGTLTVAPEIPWKAPPITLHPWGTSHKALVELPETVLVFIRHPELSAFTAYYPQAELAYEGWAFNGYLLPSAEIKNKGLSR